MCSGKPQEVQRPNSFRLRNLITKLTWIANDKERLVQPHATLTPEEASMILSHLPELTPTGAIDKKRYLHPYE